MRLLLLALFLIGLVSCGKSQSAIHREEALRWSKTPVVIAREKAATCMLQKPDKSWIFISTAYSRETGDGLVYEDGEILRSGFFVYPGAKKVSTIEDAIALAAKLPGAKYKHLGTP